MLIMNKKIWLVAILLLGLIAIVISGCVKKAEDGEATTSERVDQEVHTSEMVEESAASSESVPLAGVDSSGVESAAGPSEGQAGRESGEEATEKISMPEEHPEERPQEAPQTFGSLEISTDRDGSLYLDGDHNSDLKAGATFRLDNIETGRHVVEMRYGEDVETENVLVQKDRVHTVAFIAVGSVSVLAKVGGELFIDDVSVARVKPGEEITVQNISAGERKLEICYEDGEEEVRIIELQKDSLEIVKFSWFGKVRTDKMVLVEAGTFRMGSNSGEPWERPVHSVTIGKSFSVYKYEVTNKEFCTVMNWALDRGKVQINEIGLEGYGKNLLGIFKMEWGSQRGIEIRSGRLNPVYGRSYYPVAGVTWYGAVVFCNILSEMEKLTPCYDLRAWKCDFNANGYRLPTEAEWEFAAGGGKMSKGYTYAGSNNLSEVAWYAGNSWELVRPIGQKKPNELGIYDMSGNVEEWCWDWYATYSSSSARDPVGPERGSYRIIRGGSAFDEQQKQRVTNHDSNNMGYLYESMGFRPVWTE